jgi:hypothetical protein
MPPPSAIAPAIASSNICMYMPPAEPAPPSLLSGTVRRST